MRKPALFLCFVLLILTANVKIVGANESKAAPFLNLARYGQLVAFAPGDALGHPIRSLQDASGAAGIGVRWGEARDVREVRVHFEGAPPADAKLRYWFKNWPPPPPTPTLASIEDPVDDHWQGDWKTATTIPRCTGSECVWTFAPLTYAENPNANHLPGVRYRRTLAVRIDPSSSATRFKDIRVFSDSIEQPLAVRVVLGEGELENVTWSGSLAVDNGTIRDVRSWRFDAQDRYDSPAAWTFQTSGHGKGLILNLTTALPALAGSNDVTVVTLKLQATVDGHREDRSFSFSTDDLRKGPISVPAFHAWIAKASDPVTFQPAAGKGPEIRTMIPREPEQSMERALREIPALDPWQTEGGWQVYLPLAADSSWQKFALQYDGNVFISRHEAKLKGREKERLLWSGDTLAWHIGTGSTPYYREDHKVTVAALDKYLPVMLQKWSNDGFDVTEESYATLIRGPLSPNDPARDEQTPAVLMIRLKLHNGGSVSRKGHLWLDTGEDLIVEGHRIFAAADQEGHLYRPPVRAIVDMQGGWHLAVDSLPKAPNNRKAAHFTIEVPPGGDRSVVLKLPFVSDLTSADMSDIEQINYDSERQKVVAYWRALVDPTVRISVPEPRFNYIMRAAVVHTHITATRDPRSGLFMVSAASLGYDVFANETCFQALYLDELGDHRTAGSYLNTLLALQGTRNYAGMQTDPNHAILKGARVDPAYDYTMGKYGLDHGTVLWAAGTHALLSDDKAWFVRAWPALHKGIDWVTEQRRTTMITNARGERVREYGLLPAGNLEDNPDWAYWFTVNAYAWAGLDRIAQALAHFGLPEYDVVRAQADAYKADIRNAVIVAMQRAPVTMLRDGTYAPYVPVQPGQRFRNFGPLRKKYYSRYDLKGPQPLLRDSATREVLYGPLSLLQLDIFDVHEPIAEWILDDWEDNLTLSSGLGLNVHGHTDDRFWFSQGGLAFQSNLQNPIEVYLRRNEAPAAIRTLYNAYASCAYRDLNVFTEEFHEWRHGSGPFYKTSDEDRFSTQVRNLIVHEDGDELWLDSGVPKRWLAGAEGIRVERLPTFFGDVSLSLHGTSEPGWIEGSVTTAFRHAPRVTWLVVQPPSGQIQGVLINGQPWQAIDRERSAIKLPNERGPISIRVRYQ